MVAVRTVPRWQLGREIAEMMSKAGKTQVEVASMLEARQSRVAHILSGTTTITSGDLRLLISELGFSNAQPNYLEWLGELRRQQTKRGYWTTGPNRAYKERTRLLLEAEGLADDVVLVWVEEVPSLLQTEAYLRARLDHATLVERGVSIDDAVEAWRLRQDHLRRKRKPLRYHAVLSDSCLRNEYGGPGVMEEQIESIIEWASKPNITIQVVPSRGRTVRVGGTSFYLFTVPSHQNSLAGPTELVSVENPDEMVYVDSPERIVPFRKKVLELTAASPRPEDSVHIMRGVQSTFVSRAI